MGKASVLCNFLIDKISEWDGFFLWQTGTVLQNKKSVNRVSFT